MAWKNNAKMTATVKSATCGRFGLFWKSFETDLTEASRSLDVFSIGTVSHDEPALASPAFSAPLSNAAAGAVFEGRSRSSELPGGPWHPVAYHAIVWLDEELVRNL